MWRIEVKVKENDKGICEFVGYEWFDYKVLEIDVVNHIVLLHVMFSILNKCF